MNIKRIILTVFLCTVFSSFCFAKTQREEYGNDYLYSDAYFDYLIECAENDRDEIKDKQEDIALDIKEEITPGENDIISQEYEPFKLKIQNDTQINPWGETFKKVDSKTIIPVSDNFAFIQNTSKTRNKYNSNDYKILAGAEYNLGKYIRFASGLETNYRDIDQNPSSRKVYFSPSVYLGDKVSLTFHNKLNINSYSQDHDIGLNVSPFKSKVMDFGVYAGYTKNQSGTHSESINFSTSFYFF